MCVVSPRGVSPSPFALISSVLRVSVRVPLVGEERSVQVELVAVLIPSHLAYLRLSASFFQMMSSSYALTWAT